MGKIEEKGWGVGGDFYVQMGLGKVTRILGDSRNFFDRRFTFVRYWD